MKYKLGIKIFCSIMALGYIAMLFLGITGKGAFFQMYSNSMRYRGYLWFYLGIVFYFLLLIGIELYSSDWSKNKIYKKHPKIKMSLICTPPILLLVVHFIRDFT